MQYILFERGQYVVHEPTFAERRAILSRASDLWSARLSTGLFGLPNCPNGNRGPKDRHEVLLARSDEGLEQLVELGFIPCPVCTPEQEEGFWPVVAESVRRRYGLGSAAEFAAKELLPFDARRIEWERIIKLTGAPGRLYLPEGLTKEDVGALKERFDAMQMPLPVVGFYDHASPHHFTEYRPPTNT